MNTLIIEDEKLVEALTHRAQQQGRSVEDFLRLVVEIWPDTPEPALTSDDLSALLMPPSDYLTLAQMIEEGLAGGMEKRSDMGDSVEFVQSLRRKLWEPHS